MNSFTILRHKAGCKPSRTEVTLVPYSGTWLEVHTDVGETMGEIGYEPCNGWTAWGYAGDSSAYVDLGSYTTEEAAALALFTDEGYCVEIVSESEPTMNPLNRFASIADALASDPSEPLFVMNIYGIDWVVSAEQLATFSNIQTSPTEQFLDFEANNIRPLL